MTTDDDFIGRLEDYLESFDGETPLPGRVRDAVDAELPSTRQVRPRPGLLRSLTMSSTTSTIARWGVLAACLVVAVALGSAILLPGRGGGPGAAGGSPSPSLTSSPTPVSSPHVLGVVPQIPCDATQPSGSTCIPPGTYLVGPIVPGGLIDIPSGWFDWEPGAGSVALLVDRHDAVDGSGWGVMFMQVGAVQRDPCNQAAGTYPAAEVDTPQKLAAAMGGWPGFKGSAPESIVVGGNAGVRIRVTSTKDLSTCPTPTIWQTPAGLAIDGYPMVNGGATRLDSGYPADFSLIEIDGQVVAIRAMASAHTSPNELGQGIADDPKRHEADLVALQGIIQSLRFASPGS